MDEKHLRKLLKEFKAGRKDAEAVLAELKSLPYRDLGFARLDMRRETTGLLNVPGHYRPETR